MQRFVSFAGLAAALFVPAVLLASGCPSTFDCGGISTDAPTVDTGRGTATRSDNGAVTGAAQWQSGSFASVDITLGDALDLGVAKDVTGTDLDSLVSDGAFPICIGFGEANGTDQSALLLSSPSFKSDAAHTGHAALLKLDGNELIGRFTVQLVDSQDASKTLDITDGAFSATRRQ